MTESDRARLKRWADDVDRGFGRTAAVGLYGGQNGAGAFLVSSDGDGAALRRATAELVDVLRIRAIAGPVTALAGRVRASANGASLGGMPVTRLSIETERGTGARSKYRAACAAAGGRAALVFGSDDVDVRLSELLGGQAGPKLASDRILSDAAKRIGNDAAGAVAARFRTSSAPTFATATLGSNRSSVTVEIEGAVPVFEALLAGAPRSSAGP
jgi:hypothetical protein